MRLALIFCITMLIGMVGCSNNNNTACSGERLECEKAHAAHLPFDSNQAFLIAALIDNTQELQALSNWLTVHLENCLVELEKERGLEPLKIVQPADYESGIMKPYEKCVSEPRPFYSLYHEPNSITRIIDFDFDLRKLPSLIALNIASADMYIIGEKDRIECIEKRLQRLEPNAP